MEIVENRKMYYIVQDTSFDRKYNNYDEGEIFEAGKRHNSKRFAYRKAFFSINKTKRQKKILKIEKLHEKIRKNINKDLPSRQASIVVFESLDECLALSKKWARFNIKPLKIYEVELYGKLHKCSCTPDEKKENVSIEKHIEGITTYWKGEADTGLYEWLFQGRARVKKIINLPIND